MFPLEQIHELAKRLKVEHWIFKNDRFEIIDRILDLPRQVAVQGKRAQKKLMTELRLPTKPESPKVNHPHARTKRKGI
jgi:hypothetical protein